MILNPREYFTVARELADPNDSGTYYVQATIRNARTNALIATLNLVDQTGQVFSKPWQVPDDSSGLGFYIIIRTRVYTDALYTSLSDAYGQELSTFLVDNRFRNLGGGGGGGGDDVDYKKIRKIVKEENGLVIQAFPDLNLSSIISAFKPVAGFVETILSHVKSTEARTVKIVDEVRDHSSILGKIDAKEFPHIPDPTDITPVLEAIKNLPAPTPATDLSPVLKAISNVSDILNSKDLKDIISAFPELAKSAKDMDQQMRDFVFLMQKQGSPKEEGTQIKPPAVPVPEKPDYQAQARELVGKRKP